MKRLPILLLATFVAAAALADRRVLVYSSFANGQEKQHRPKPKRARMIEPAFDALDAPPLRKNERKKMERQLTAALFDDTILHLDLVEVERNAVDATVWTGKVAGEDGSSAVIVVKDRTMVASIWTGTHKYTIEPAPDGGHEAVELDLGAFPNELAPLRPQVAAGSGAGVSANAVVEADSGATIDVLVAYTGDVRAALGSTAAAQAAATSAIAATNTAYANSGVVPRVRLVGTLEVAYTETGDLLAALNSITSNGDGVMDEVHPLRAQLGADAVALLLQNGGGACGVAWMMQSFYVANPGFSFAGNAFATVDNDCAVGNLSFPHELGHNFGLTHDRFVSPSSDPSYPYAFGYVDTMGQFRDIMGYANACGGCVRVPYFSSPNLSYLSRPLGVSYESSPSTSADAVRALNNNASRIANWMQSVTGPVYTPATFTDDPLVASATVVKALHMNELRTAINTYRAAAPLPAYAWSTTISGGTVVTAAQLDELRTALTPALQAFSRTATYTNQPLTAGTQIRAVHIQELRNYLK